MQVKSNLQRRAVIDIGSNSVKLLVADVKGNKIQPIFESAHTTRLGEGLSHHSQLSPQAVKRTFAAIKKLYEKAQKHGATTIRAFGTSALRSCDNPQVLLMLLERKLQLPVQILSEDQEARYIFQGVLSDSQIPHDYPSLVMDLGGGSAEFILGEKNKIHHQTSLKIGCVRMKEKFFPRYPINFSFRKSFESFLENQFSKHSFLQKPKSLIITGGTISCLLPWLNTLTSTSERRFEKKLLSKLTDELLVLNLSSLLSHPFLPRDRADLMPAGCFTLNKFISLVGIKYFYISLSNLRYGLILNKKI